MKIKTLILSAAVLTLGACAMVPTDFDNALYDRLVVTDVNLQFVHDNLCDHTALAQTQEAVINIQRNLDVAQEYLKHRDGNQDLNKAIGFLNDDMKSFEKSFTQPQPPSPAYCKAKTEIAKNSLDKILDAIGGKP